MKGIVLLVVSLFVCRSDAAQPPPPPPADFRQRLADLRRKVERQPAVDVSAQRALQYAKRYVERAERTYRQGHQAQADRIAAASAALLRVAEHQQHLRNGGGPVPPNPEELEEHLHRVYFRTEQADYFLREARDSSAAPFPEWARDFYQLAVRAYDRREWVAADEDGKCAEEVTVALESLAQAANLSAGDRPPAPPPPAPPQPPRL